MVLTANMLISFLLILGGSLSLRRERVFIQKEQRVQNEGRQDGPYLIGNDSDRPKNEAGLRDSLWRHWRRHKVGHVMATWISKEGKTSRNTFVFENDERGAWTIRVVIERRWARDSPIEHSEYRAYSVQRVEKPDPKWEGSYTNIPDEAEVFGADFLILLKSADGKKEAVI